jgi:hypothetical protein
MIDGEDVSACGIAINAETAQQTENMCDRDVDVAKTPYGSQDSTSTTYVRGADFTASQKTKIKNANSTQTIINPDGTLQRIFDSDAYKISTATNPHIDVKHLFGDPGFPESAEVDHLIPRTDKFGCGCGTNAPSNALLISRQLNNSMSNNSADKNRKAILDFFAPMSTPSLVPVTEDPVGSDVDGDPVDDDASVESEPAADDAAGCSAGSSTLGGFGLGAVALGLTHLARRRKRA